MPQHVRPLAIPEIVESIPAKYCDECGFFSETFNAEAFGPRRVPDPVIEGSRQMRFE